MNSLNKYFSSKYRREQIEACGEDSFANICTIEYAELKEAEARIRELEPTSFRDALDKQSLITPAF